MKILLVTSSFAGGGITSYAHEFIRCFAQGNELSVIIGDDSQNPIDKKLASVYYYKAEDTSLKNAMTVAELINKSIDPDVIINSNAVLMSLIAPYIKNNIRIISVSHSLRYDEADVAGCCSDYIDSIIALSTYGQKYIESNYGCKNKVHIVYNFVNDIPELDQIRESKKKSKRIKIVFSGGTSAAKTPELVFKIMQHLAKLDLDFEFYFLGVHSPTLKSVQPFKSIKELLPNDPRFILPGRVPHNQALALMNSANIFLCPSRREGCPMAMLEAMRCGAIIITSDYDNACKEMIRDGVNGFVIPHNKINLFVDRIKDIINNNDSYGAMYENSYLNYTECFSFQPWKTQMEKIVNSSCLNHTHRFIEFSEKKFRKDLQILNRRFVYNKYHMLLFETLKSAGPFFCEYIKKKLKVNR